MRGGMSIREQIRAHFRQLLCIAAAFLVIAPAAAFYVGDCVRAQLRQAGETGMDAAQSSVTAGMSETELLFANMVLAVENMLGAGKPNAEILAFLKQTNEFYNTENSPLPDFIKVYGEVRGEFLDGAGWKPPADYTPAQRPWYVGAKGAAGGIAVSAPYRDAETGGLCISLSQTLNDQRDRPLGVLAVDMQLSRIADYAHKLRVAGKGYGVLLDENMTIVAHRNEALIGRAASEAGGGYPALARLFAQSASLSAHSFTDADNTPGIAFFRTLRGDWRIGVIIAETDYYAPLYRLIAVPVASCLALALVSGVLLVRSRAGTVRSHAEKISKSGLLSRISHEIRTPMNAVIGMAGIAARSEDRGEIRACLAKIQEASRHLLDVISDVLDMSHIEAGKLTLNADDFSLPALLRQVEAAVRPKAEEKGRHFTIETDANVPPALIADRRRLAQVLLNLLSNANKFTPPGGRISLRIRRLPDDDAPPPPVGEESCTLLVEVEDNGVGLSPEQQAGLFQSAEEREGGFSPRYGSTGLGLAISGRIVEMMGGAIGVESAPGRGARFFFTFRAGVGSAPEEYVPHAERLTGDAVLPGDPIFAGKRLLLVEDIEINREVLLSLLAPTGIAIDCAENGRAARDLFAASPDAYDIIFMDIHMPVMDGWEAARHIRSLDLPQAKIVPIIAITANVFSEDIEKCRAAGMDGHVAKPLDFGELLAVMRQYLGVRK